MTVSNPRSALRQRLRLWRRTDLLSVGISRSGIESRVRTGALRKLGRTWYGTDKTPQVVAAALRRGTRLTCVSALRHYGVWVPPVQETHEVSLRSRTSPSTPTATHRYLRAWPDDEPLVPLTIALEHAGRCLDVEEFATVLESAAHQGLLGAGVLEDILRSTPRAVRRKLGRISHRAESGSETRVRRYMEQLGLTVVPQVWFGDFRVDMLVGDRLVIECDSHAHHSDEKAYRRDRRRDRALAARGYHVVRLTWEDVWLTWDETVADLRSIIAEGAHRHRR